MTSARIPEFRIELWGYERRSVDAYVAQLTGGGADPEVLALRQRVAELESEAASTVAPHAGPTPPVSPTLPEAGSEAGRLLTEAGELAERVQRRALELAQRTVADAEAHVARITAEAQRTLEHANAMRDGAEQEAREIADRAFSEARIEIQRRSASLRADVDRLLEVRDRTLTDLIRLRGEVGTLITHGA